ncbi:MAG: hypothetical protein RL095_570 [Verrucomicrobiota bacterium]|jgi:hypothetical protein
MNGYVKAAGGCLLLGGILFILFIDLMLGANLIQWLFHLGFGFIAYAGRVSPSARELGLLLAACVAAGLLIHFLLPRLLRQRQNQLAWTSARSLRLLLVLCGLLLAAGGGAFALKNLPPKGDLLVRVSLLKDDNYWYEAAVMLEETRKLRPLPADGLKPGDPLIQEILTRLNDRGLQEVFEFRLRLAPSGRVSAILLRIPDKPIAGVWELSLVSGEMRRDKTLVWPGAPR